MIKIGWEKDEIGLFDYTNKTIVSFKIEDEVILINFDKENNEENEELEIIIKYNDKGYDEISNLFNDVFSMYEKKKIITDEKFCTTSLNERIVNYISLQHGTDNKLLQGSVFIYIQRNKKLIEYKLISKDKEKTQVIIDKKDNPELFEIYTKFISKVQKQYNNEQENSVLETCSSKLFDYNIKINQNNALLDEFVLALYCRELDNNPTKEEIRESLDLIKYMISENQRLNNERQELYDGMLNKVENKSVTTLNTIPEKTRILRKDH